jgi:hypothetical protein
MYDIPRPQRLFDPSGSQRSITPCVDVIDRSSKAHTYAGLYREAQHADGTRRELTGERVAGQLDSLG